MTAPTMERQPTDNGMRALLERFQFDAYGLGAAGAGIGAGDSADDAGARAIADVSLAGKLEAHLGTIGRELVLERQRKARDLAKRLRGIAPVWLPPMPFIVTGGVLSLDPARATTAQELGPSDGYAWFITRAIVAGLTASAGGASSIQGTTTNPGANAVIASISAGTLQGIANRFGPWDVTWSPSLQGTIAAGDANNMRLTSPLGTTQQQGIFPGVAGNYGPFTARIFVNAGNGINVQTNGAASGASAVYGSTLSATWAGGGDSVDLRKVSATGLNNYLGSFSQAAPDKNFSSSSFFVLPDDNLLLTGSGLMATQVVLNCQAIQVELALLADYLM